jgi:hypothetical protein
MVIHNSVRLSRSVHSANMSYPFIFILVNFFQNWFCFEFSYAIFIPLVIVQCAYCGFSKKIIPSALIVALSYTFSVKVSLPYSRVSTATVLCIRILVCF